MTAKEKAIEYDEDWLLVDIFKLGVLIFVICLLFYGLYFLLTKTP